MLMAGAISQVIAHETKTVEGYDVTFGAADEPLITSERMWLEIEIADNETGEPIENQSETLTIMVQKLGVENTTVKVGEKHGEPGVRGASHLHRTWRIPHPRQGKYRRN